MSSPLRADAGVLQLSREGRIEVDCEKDKRPALDTASFYRDTATFAMMF
jgi:hypothetical protein